MILCQTKGPLENLPPCRPMLPAPDVSSGSLERTDVTCSRCFLRFIRRDRYYLLQMFPQVHENAPMLPAPDVSSGSLECTDVTCSRCFLRFMRTHRCYLLQMFPQVH